MLLNASKIKINGVLTDDKGVYPKGRYEVPTPEEDTEIIYIRGRDGELTKKYGYRNIDLPILFYMKDESFKTAFRKAKSFILNAKTLQVDDDDEVFYKVKSVNINPAENLMKTFGEFVADFVLDPFAYEIDNEPITITSQTTINNPGYEALPVITAHMSGTGNVYVNEQKVTINNVNGEITIDSEMQNAYRIENGYIVNLNSHMIGRFPVLEHGQNTISFDGDINKIELIKNWRWV